MPLDRITPSRPFEFEAIRKADKVTFKIDGHTFHETSCSGDPLGTVGFTFYVKDGKSPRAPDVPQLRIFEFSVVGRTRPIQEIPLTRPWRNTLPEVDISGEEERIVTIAAGTDVIHMSYPSTVLMPDGMFPAAATPLRCGAAVSRNAAWPDSTR